MLLPNTVLGLTFQSLSESMFHSFEDTQQLEMNLVFGNRQMLSKAKQDVIYQHYCHFRPNVKPELTKWLF